MIVKPLTAVIPLCFTAFFLQLHLSFGLQDTDKVVSDNWIIIESNIVKNEYKMDGISLTHSMEAFNLVRRSPEAIPAVVPGTIITSLLRNKSFGFSDPYFGNLLQDIPDINATGRSFYTYWFLNEFDASSLSSRDPGHLRNWLSFSGINYVADIYLNGVLLHRGSDKYPGMFLRLQLEITSQMTAASNRLAVLVHPPLHTGTSRHGGQGGDHEFARNGAIQQSTLGWDWIQATPDRNTGIWDDVTLSSSGIVSLHDTVLQTVSICDDQSTKESSTESNMKKCSAPEATLRLLTKVWNHAEDTVHGNILITLHNLNSTTLTFPVQLDGAEERSLIIDNIHLSGVRFWWPFSLGEPFLYSVTVEFRVDDPVPPSVDPTAGQSPSAGDVGNSASRGGGGGGGGYVSARVSFRHGIRVIESAIHPVTNGRYFLVNKVPIFLIGGNWISTDQFLRYSNGNKESVRRYQTEVRMHREMGMNLIRVWGGGITERAAFYDACDELGVLVMQEFWMTGDNNGRWGGSYEWPDDHGAYLANVRNTVLSLRGHASLMLWCGGNELHPVGKNPPSDIASSLAKIIASLDAGRPFIMSSMSPQNPDPSQFDQTFALAPIDGPYQVLPLDVWYTHRNPGLPGFEQTSVSFQPEVGSVSTPLAASLRRFLPQTSLEAFPREGARVGEVDPLWDYHKYLEYTSDDWAPVAGSDTGESFRYDHIYAYGNPTDIDEYCWRAQLVQYAQYRAIIEGYSKGQWEHYSAVLIWKSQSPWPALRGGLYDYYLDQTGGFYGIQAAARSHVHIAMHPSTLDVYVINRLPKNVNHLSFAAEMFGSDGVMIHREIVAVATVASLSVTTLPSMFRWPTTHHKHMRDGAFPTVYFFRFTVLFYDTSSSSSTVHPSVEGVGGVLGDHNVYWLTNPALPALARKRNYAELGALRAYHRVDVDITAVILSSEGSSGSSGGVSGRVLVSLSLSQQSPHIAFMIVLSLHRQGTPEGEQEGAGAGGASSYVDSRVLPVWYSSNYITLLPGESTEVVVDGSSAIGNPDKDVPNKWLVKMDGWNVLPKSVAFT